MSQADPENAPLLALRHITLAYGRNRVVDDVSLTIEPGELVCLLGPSGCGKTSTLRIASGVERQTEGVVLVDGVEISGSHRHDPPEKRQIGLMFQDFALFPHMSVSANVAFGLKDLDKPARRKRALDALERMEIGHLAEAYPHMLSGGEQQRVALCRALAPEPRIMLMDEPFSGLDKGLRNAIRGDTRRILLEAGASGLLVTHDADEAMRIADRIVLMRSGKFVQIGSPRDIFENPADLESAKLFSEINVLEGIVKGGSAVTPVGTVNANGVPDGATVDIGLRQSDILRVGLGTGRSEGADHKFSATVRSVRYLGDCNLVDLEPPENGPLVQARLPESSIVAPGDRIELQISADRILVFPR